MRFLDRKYIIYSPFLIICINIITALSFGKMMEKWVFIPIILIQWLLMALIICVFSSQAQLIQWLQFPKKHFSWVILSVLVALIPIPIFLKYHYLLNHWTIVIPWILIALINPWMEEFFWRGLLSEATKKWSTLHAALFSALLFSINHIVFAIHSELFRGPEVFITTFIIGLIWGICFIKSKSLFWLVVAHFCVDFLNLSVPAFLDLFKPNL